MLPDEMAPRRTPRFFENGQSSSSALPRASKAGTTQRAVPTPFGIWIKRRLFTPILLLALAGSLRAAVLVPDRFTFDSNSTNNVSYSGHWSKYQGPLYTGPAYTKSTTATGATATYRPLFNKPQKAKVLIYRFVEVLGQYPFAAYTGNDNQVQITVVHDGETNTLYMDSSVGQNGYWSAGVYDFSGGSNEWVSIQRISAETGNATKAGLVRFDVTLDTATTFQAAPAVPLGYTEQGAWQATSWVGYSDYAKPRLSTENQATATWNPGPLAPQTLRVACFIPALRDEALTVTNGGLAVVHFRNTRTDQPLVWNTTPNGALQFQIFHNGKVDTLSVDTAGVPPGWYTLGNWDFAGNTNEYVTCTRMNPDGAPAVVDSVSFDDIRYGGSLLRSVIVTPMPRHNVITADSRFLDSPSFQMKLDSAQVPPGYAEVGEWGGSSLAGATPWGIQRAANGGSHSSATWNPLITESGNYQISAACMAPPINKLNKASQVRSYQAVQGEKTTRVSVDVSPRAVPGKFSLFWTNIGGPQFFDAGNDAYLRLVPGQAWIRNDAVKFEKAVAGGAILKSILVNTLPVFLTPQFNDAADLPEATRLAIEFVASHQLMSATASGEFGSQQAATLGDYLIGTTRLLGLTGDPLKTALNKGWIDSWPSKDQARPTDEINRETALVIAQAVVRSSGKQINVLNPLDAVTHFHDANSVSDWAQPACGRALAEEWVSLDGNGCLRPQGSLTRADMALLLYNVAVKGIQAGPRTNDLWKLVFHDEFNGNSVNWNNWGFACYDGSSAIGARWPENAVVTNGLLHLYNYKENRQGHRYSAGALSTRAFAPTNGYCECRLRLAATYAQHTSWWARSGVKHGSYTNDFLEIDSPEAEYPNTVSQHLAYVPDFQWEKQTSFDLSHDFHLYAWEWDTNGVSFYLDGEVTGRKTWASSTNYPHYFPLNLGLPLIITGSQLGPGPLNFERMDGSVVDVDWVRVYQKAP